MSKYKDQQFDCCYVFNQNFRNEVDKFDLPKGLNLINSVRLLDLNLELQKLNKSMTLSQVSSTKFVVLLTQLESLDWVFLNDLELSQPFWDALKVTAPVFLSKGVNALVRRGTKNPVSAADVNKALSGK